MTRHVPPHILLVDDEPDLRELLAEAMEAQGWRITQAGDGAEMRDRMAAALPDLIVMDLRMPGDSGLDLLRWLRGGAHAGLPVVMLTAQAEMVDRVLGLEFGADDYIAKPFHPREVVARIKAVLRRVAPAGPPAGAATPAAAAGPGGTPARPERLRMGRVWLDLTACCLVGDDGQTQPLTALEFDLLSTFARAPGRVLSRDQLLDMAHDKPWEPFDRSIDIRISRLRRKIEPDPSHPRILRTVRGQGSMFAPDPEPPP